MSDLKKKSCVKIFTGDSLNKQRMSFSLFDGEMFHIRGKDESSKRYSFSLEVATIRRVDDIIFFTGIARGEKEEVSIRGQHYRSERCEDYISAGEERAHYLLAR